MKLFKIVVFAALAMVSSVSVQAAVVLSNLGANGLTDNSGDLSTGILSSNLIAAGFTTGSVAQTLDSVSLVVSNTGGNKAVSLFSDIGGSPGGSLVASASTAVSNKGVYTFNFAGYSLSASTRYWILPEAGMTWYRVGIPVLDNPATEQNGSGFLYNGVKRSTDSGASWIDRTQNYTISVSSTDDVGPPPPPAAVPEPALTSLLCLSGIALIRRRMNK
jgi:hypothetical protein